MKNIKQKYHVKIDTEQEDVFRLYDKTTGECVATFPYDDKGLYTVPLPPTMLNQPHQQEHQQYLDTMKENAIGFNNKQIEDAKRARAIYHSSGAPHPEKFKKMIQYNMIKNNPVTIEHVKLAERIFGKDVATIKGKTVRRAPPPVINDIIELPKEFYANNQDLTLCIDTMFINKMPFLMGIDTSIRYRSVVPIENGEAESYYKAIDVMFRTYNAADFRIQYIHCDQEFEPLFEPLQDDLGVTINPANS